MAMRPLSTFSARINIVHRLGLIDTPFARALHLVRKLRNDFAHDVSGCRLDVAPHRDRVRELVLPFRKHGAFLDFCDLFTHDKSGQSAEFYAILGLMVLGLENALQRVVTVTATNGITLTPARYSERMWRRDETGTLQKLEPATELSTKKS